MTLLYGKKPVLGRVQLLHPLMVVAIGLLLAALGFLASCGDDGDDGDDADDCPAGSDGCPCTDSAECDSGLTCVDNSTTVSEAESGDFLVCEVRP